MRVAAVIPNWNGAALLRTLLPTIASQTRRFDAVIVVDNGSADDSVAVARAFGAEVVELRSNLGFAVAVNRGVDRSGADIVAILNNDVELALDWLQQGLARFLASSQQDESVSFVAGKTLNTADTSIVDGTFDAICRGGCAMRCGSGQPDGGYWSAPRSIRMAPMTALLVKANVFLRLGGLDEAFESYMEDVEFGLRCASNGYTGVYEPAMVARHRGSATLGAWNARTVRNISRNQVLVLARHYDYSALLRFGWPIAVAQGLWGLLAIRHGQVAAWLTGKIDGLRLFRSLRRSGRAGLPGILLESERTIAEVCRETEPGWYWRLYFALTPRVPDR